jgi:hypothetical protein
MYAQQSYPGQSGLGATTHAGLPLHASMQSYTVQPVLQNPYAANTPRFASSAFSGNAAAALMSAGPVSPYASTPNAARIAALQAADPRKAQAVNVPSQQVQQQLSQPGQPSVPCGASRPRYVDPYTAELEADLAKMGTKENAKKPTAAPALSGGQHQGPARKAVKKVGRPTPASAAPAQGPPNPYAVQRAPGANVRADYWQK